MSRCCRNRGTALRRCCRRSTETAAPSGGRTAHSRRLESRSAGRAVRPGSPGSRGRMCCRRRRSAPRWERSRTLSPRRDAERVDPAELRIAGQHGAAGKPACNTSCAAGTAGNFYCRRGNGRTSWIVDGVVDIRDARLPGCPGGLGSALRRTTATWAGCGYQRDQQRVDLERDSGPRARRASVAARSSVVALESRLEICADAFHPARREGQDVARVVVQGGKRDVAAFHVAIARRQVIQRDRRSSVEYRP